MISCSGSGTYVKCFTQSTEDRTSAPIQNTQQQNRENAGRMSLRLRARNTINISRIRIKIKSHEPKSPIPLLSLIPFCPLLSLPRLILATGFCIQNHIPHIAVICTNTKYETRLRNHSIFVLISLYSQC